MGIRNLNKFLLEKCSKYSIKKIHLSCLKGKCIAIDTSIYLYKFKSEDKLIENMTLMINTLLKYHICPMFIFEGKPPPEKKDLLKKRRVERYEAAYKYKELQSIIDNETCSSEQKQQLEMLKRKMTRIYDDDIAAVKELMNKLNVSFYDSPEEADQLCGYLMKIKKVWGCLSDDMDMFLYDSNRIIRNLNLINHTVMIYNVNKILKDLNMSHEDFRKIMVLSGTDYNINSETNLYDTLKKYEEFMCCKNNPNQKTNDFYQWLLETCTYIKNYNELKHIYNMFLLENFTLDPIQN